MGLTLFISNVYLCTILVVRTVVADPDSSQV